MIELLNSPEALSARGEAIAAVKAAAPNVDLNKVQEKLDVLLAHGAGAVETEMTAGAMLLSLGAPFWFNLLKSLTNLRSSVAEQIDNEKKSANT